MTKKPTKRKVSMTRTLGTATTTAVDYVPVTILDAYVADARSRWDVVDVGALDDGPGGPHFTIPAHLQES